jgi:hypothetical protein
MQNRNTAADAIIARLPNKELLNAREIADALDLVSTTCVISAIDQGDLPAVHIGHYYRITRKDTIAWIYKGAI